jgi:hypothetical protein
MQAAQLIALLLPDTAGEPWTITALGSQGGATALMRDAQGQIRLEKVTTPATGWSEQMLSTGCFKRGKPIVDPMTREVMGYEMEMVPNPISAQVQDRGR